MDDKEEVKQVVINTNQDLDTIPKFVKKAAPVVEEIFEVVEQMPEFPGGYEKMMEYLSKNIKYPQMAKEAGVKGKVYVQFVVGSDGKITDIKTIRGIGSGCDEVAMAAVKKMPKWTPGEQRGKKVPVRFVLPVNFTLR